MDIWRPLIVWRITGKSRAFTTVSQSRVGKAIGGVLAGQICALGTLKGVGLSARKRP